MIGRSGAGTGRRSASRIRFLIGAFLTSLIAGVVTFAVADNVILVSTYELSTVTVWEDDGWEHYQGTHVVWVVGESGWVAGEGGRGTHFWMLPGIGYASPSTVKLGWGSIPGFPREFAESFNFTYDEISEEISFFTIYHGSEAGRYEIGRLDGASRGLAAGLLALVVGLSVLLIRRVRWVLRACYSGAPEPRPARYLALVSVFLPEREQQQWWRELCSTLAESPHRDRRRHSWSYLGAAPALILTSWCVCRARPARQTER